MILEEIRTTDQNEMMRPWQRVSIVPPKPDDADYGYLENGQLQPCSFEELKVRCQKIGFFTHWPPPEYVWTPETTKLVSPARVPELFESLVRQRLKSANSLFLSGMLLLGIFLLALIGRMSFDRRTLTILLLFLGIPGIWAIVSSIRMDRQTAVLTPESFEKEIDHHYLAWLKSFRTTYTRDIAACIFFVACFQVTSLSGSQGNAIEAAGLMKAATRAGDYWRLLTGTLLHVNFQHFWVNCLSLLSLGKLVEVFTHPAYLPPVFVLSALSDSLMSLFWLPDKNSVGASGGVMGLIGFLLVASWFRQDVFPKGQLKKLGIIVSLNAAIGIIGFDFIDNAGHLGGLLAGAVAGFILLRKGDTTFPLPVGKSMKIIAVVSLIVYVCAGVLAGAAIGGTVSFLITASVFFVPLALTGRQASFLDKL